MQAARLARTTLEAFNQLHRWERVAWLVRAERELHSPPQQSGAYDAGAVRAWQRS